MRRGFPLLLCLLALTSAAPAHAVAPFELDTKVDYAGLRCITGTGRVALVVGVHYRDVQERFEQVSYLVKHVAELHATIRGASRSMRLEETVRIPVGLWGRRNVDHRHTIIVTDKRVAEETGSAPCPAPRGFRVHIRVSQRLEQTGGAGGGSQAIDLPPAQQRSYTDLLALMSANPNGQGAELDRVAVTKDQRALVFDGCIFQRGAICPGVNLTGSLLGSRTPVLGYIVGASRIDLRGADLDGASLSGVSMSNAQLQGVVGRGVQIAGSNLLGASLAGADLTGAVGGASWNGPSLLEPPFPAILQWANAPRAKLAGAALERATLTNGQFAGADFSGADLSNADLQGADLRGAKFNNADLSGADLLGANVDGANFDGADLSKTTDPSGEVIPNGTVGTAGGTGKR